MILVGIVLIGALLGSFVNALVWRLREQELELSKKKPNKKALRKLSITRGQSMCPHCNHKLSAVDLVPVLSWVFLRGKCRYCDKNISAQYPLVELTTSLLFAVSYIYWPLGFSDGAGVALFALWILLLTGFIALTVYDLKWYLLPDRIMFPVGALAFLYALIAIVSSEDPLKATLGTVLAVLIGGGIFYVLFQVSKGKWIGGGDVKLGWVLGAIAGTPAKSILFIFIASLLGTAASVGLIASKKLKKDHIIPFGPFLIAGLYVVELWGSKLLDWYTATFINF